MENQSASQQIDNIIKLHGGWKGEFLSQLRAVITSASNEIVEEVKWKTPSRPEGLPVWSHHGIICLAEVWKDNVKLIFTKGVHLTDPHKLFNARLKSSTDRAIELREGNTIDKSALKALVVEAADLNASKAS